MVTTSSITTAAVAGLLELVFKSSLVAVVACVVGMWTSHAWKGL